MHDEELDQTGSEGNEARLDEETLDEFLEDEGPEIPESLGEEE